MMKRFAPFMLCLLLLSGCSHTIEDQVDRYVDERQSIYEDEIEASENGLDYLETTYQTLVDEGANLETTSRGEIIDDDWHRSQFSYASAVADATDLDFVKIASLEFARGLSGVDALVLAFQEGEYGYDEANRLMRVQHLTNSLHDDYEITLSALEDVALSEEEQVDVYLAAFLESVYLRVSNAEVSTSRTSYSEAATCSDELGLDFETLAIIQAKTGTRGLSLVIERFPGVSENPLCQAALGNE